MPGIYVIERYHQVRPIFEIFLIFINSLRSLSLKLFICYVFRQLVKNFFFLNIFTPLLVGNRTYTRILKRLINYDRDYLELFLFLFTSLIMIQVFENINIFLLKEKVLSKKHLQTNLNAS